MKKTLYLMVAAALMTLASCYEDTGNYDYTDLQNLSISLPSDGYTMPVGSELKVSPTVTTDIADSDIQYIWEVGVSGGIDSKYYEFREIAKGKDLDYKCLISKYMPATGSYVLRLHAKQTSTGRDFYSSHVSLNLAGQTGLIVLHGDGSQCDMGLIVDTEFMLNTGQDVTRTVYPNYFSGNNNGQKINGKGKFVVQREGGWGTINNRYHSIFAVTDKDNVAANYGAMTKIDGGWGILFYGGLNKGVPEGFVFDDSGNRLYQYVKVYTFDGGELYGTQGSNVVLRPKIGNLNAYVKGYDIAPYMLIGASSGGSIQSIVFDRASKAFIAIPNANSLNYGNDFSSSQMFALDVDGGAFNPAEMNADLLYMASGGLSNHGLAVFQRSDGSKFIADLVLNAGTTYSNIPAAIYELGGQPDIDNAFNFAFVADGSTIYANYYATPDGIYSFTANGVNGSDVSAETLHKHDGTKVTFPGELITRMKILTFNGIDHLYVATYNTSTSAGTVHTMEIDPVTGCVSGDITDYAGFGKIYDFDLKHM